MKKLAKMMALFIVSVMMLSVVSCSNPTSSGSGGGGTGSGSGGNNPTPPKTVAVIKVSLNIENVYGEKGETFQLAAEVLPWNATDKTVRWSTSDENIATVDDSGLVTLGSATPWDTATITVTTNDGNKSATCNAYIIKKSTATRVSGTDFVEIRDGSMPLLYDSSEHVTLTRPYMICDHEVTQEEWTNIMTDNPSYFDGTTGKEVADGEVQENRPVEKIDFYKALIYCNERTKAENIKRGTTNEIDYVYFNDENFTTPYTYMYGTIYIREDAKGYRLPTEDEWEIAARGGMLGDCYAGTNVESELEKYAWCWINNVSDDRTHEVKKKLPNAYGLYDMSGNVRELVWTHYKSITRGGSYNDSKSWNKATSRFNYSTSELYKYVGFRVVRIAE